jgi:hypothetical protein
MHLVIQQTSTTTAQDSAPTDLQSMAIDQDGAQGIGKSVL